MTSSIKPSMIFRKFEDQMVLNMWQCPNFISAKLLVTDPVKNIAKVPEKNMINLIVAVQQNMIVIATDTFTCSPLIFYHPNIITKFAD